jgi:hypothetical protein
MALSKIDQISLNSNVAGNGPAFSAYFNGSTSIASNTATKITLDTEDFDTAGAFNNTGSTVGTAPSYSFNPQVAGYYQIEAGAWFNGTTIGGSVFSYLRKNGSAYKTGAGAYSPTNGHGGAVVSAVIYLNGSTDYVELFTTQTTAASQSLGGSNGVYMSGSLVRAA